MCLIVFAWKVHRNYPLVLATNRDEFHNRPTQAMRWWPNQPEILAGRDLQSGGTWLAASRTGKLTIVTNYREDPAQQATIRSRGKLVTAFVTGKQSPVEYSRSIARDNYAGFNLLTGDTDKLCYTSNRGDEPRSLSPGVYGLSNASLDTPWFKLKSCREKLREIAESGDVSETELLHVMADRQMAASPELEPGTHCADIGRALTAPFIVTPEYGTRCTSILLRDNSGHTTLRERSFDALGQSTSDTRFDFVASTD